MKGRFIANNVSLNILAEYEWLFGVDHNKGVLHDDVMKQINKYKTPKTRYIST